MHLRFIADAMLGRLARWLRLLGFDTLYYPDISDIRLLRVAKEQGRLILTRDTRLIKIRGIKDYLLIRANDSFQQLLEVIHALKLKDFNPLSRCVICNGKLSRLLDKTEIKDSVPDFVFLNFHIFQRCSDCGKIYWEGTHPRMFREKLTEVLSSYPSSSPDLLS
ncbi:MAG: Mut7-C RNAse domain-containing protein [Thermodesulfovibrionales bacterium]|nr:Mut7-C RNAse domain-containing protein [Thermodesulfovibrionales bacterium]